MIAPRTSAVRKAGLRYTGVPTASDVYRGAFQGGTSGDNGRRETGAPVDLNVEIIFIPQADGVVGIA